jgi:hypothetical protein
MRQTLTLELSEEIFAVIQQQAQTVGISPAQLAASLLEQRFTMQTSKVCLDESEKGKARERFERHFGTLTLKDSTSLDNDQIDRDLYAC